MYALGKYPTSTMNLVTPVRVHLPPNEVLKDDWPVIFQDLVLNQRERMNKAFERYRFAASLLFPQEEQNAQLYMQRMEQGLGNFTRLVLQENAYIDFGSGKREAITGPHGKSSAIIHFLASTGRAIDDFNRFLDRHTTPEAMKGKCAALPADQCAQPCRHVKTSRLSRSKCGFA
jgi:hypothetical protein